MPTVQVLDAKGKQAGTLELSADVFGGEIKVPLLHQAVVRELADRRTGTHDTKGRSEVSGGGRKPWKQKGTGRARQGSIRATQWKGGGKPFGPTPHSYDKDMPRQMRREALRAAVGATIAGAALRVVESLASDGKTKTLVAASAQLGLQPVPTWSSWPRWATSPHARRPQRAVAHRGDPGHVSVYQVLHARQVVFERAALKALEEALGHEGPPRDPHPPLMTEKSMQQKETLNTVRSGSGPTPTRWRSASRSRPCSTSR